MSAAMGRVPERLRLCRACRQFVHPGEAACFHCGADLDAADRAHVEKWGRAMKAALELERLLGLK